MHFTFRRFLIGPLAALWMVGAAAAPAADDVRVVVGLAGDDGYGFVLGGYRGDLILQQGAAAGALGGGEQFQRYSLRGLVGTARCTKVVPDELVPGQPIARLSLSPAGTGDKEPSVAVHGGSGSVQPRPTFIQSTEQPVYRKAMADFLATKQVTAPAALVLDQVLRVDLDGDGTMEVLVAATSRHQTGMAQAGDLTAILLRRVAGHGVPTGLVDGEFWPHAGGMMTGMFATRVNAIVDLDGDGTMEIVTEYRAYESYTVKVFRLVDEAIEQLFIAGTGA